MYNFFTLSVYFKPEINCCLQHPCQTKTWESLYISDLALYRTPCATIWAYTSALYALRTLREPCGPWTRANTRNDGRRSFQGMPPNPNWAAAHMLPLLAVLCSCCAVNLSQCLSSRLFRRLLFAFGVLVTCLRNGSTFSVDQCSLWARGAFSRVASAVIARTACKQSLFIAHKQCKHEKHAWRRGLGYADGIAAVRNGARASVKAAVCKNVFVLSPAECHSHQPLSA